MPVARTVAAPVAFLTRIPVGRLFKIEGEDVARGAPLFPLVGAGIGALAGTVASLPLPPMVAGVLALATVALLTGAMHLDALADAADALGGSTPEQRLTIMRDHATGSFGVTAVSLVLVFDTAVLAAVEDPFRAFVVAGACSRWASLPLAAALPAARVEGQGRALATGISWTAAAVGLALASTVSLAAYGWRGLAPLAAAAAVALIVGVAFRRLVGGVTGDVLGATTELAQAAALLSAL